VAAVWVATIVVVANEEEVGVEVDHSARHLRPAFDNKCHLSTVVPSTTYRQTCRAWDFFDEEVRQPHKVDRTLEMTWGELKHLVIENGVPRVIIE